MSVQVQHQILILFWLHDPDAQSEARANSFRPCNQGDWSEVGQVAIQLFISPSCSDRSVCSVPLLSFPKDPEANLDTAHTVVSLDQAGLIFLLEISSDY